MTLTLYRSDFGGNADSTGMPYFDCVLSALGIAQDRWSAIDSIEVQNIQPTDIDTTTEGEAEAVQAKHTAFSNKPS